MRLLFPLALAALAAGCGGTTTRTVTVARTVTETVTRPGLAACPGSALRGSFGVIRGSAGAGQVSYRLRLVNRSGSRCFVSGLPSVTLLGAGGKPLPTGVRAARPRRSTARRVVLASGEAASAEARFSPDVPGPQEQHPGRCEPTASSLRYEAPGGGGTTVPVRPPTPVCERGRLSFSVFTAG